MISGILHAIKDFTTGAIDSLGLAGIAVLMAIESACIPLPSELIMPYAGYRVHEGDYSLIGAAIAGAIGCVLGSWVAYWVGKYGGRPLAERYGRYVFFSRRDLDLADRWFERWGLWAAFISRMLPVIRTFISFPAGVSRVRLVPFTILTFVGSVPWCYLLAWFGMKLAEHWEDIKSYFHGADIVIGLAIAAGLAWWIARGIKHRREDAASAADPGSAT